MKKCGFKKTLSCGFMLALFAAVFPLAMAAPASAQDAPAQTAAFSIATDDGLVVLHGPMPALLEARDKISSALGPGATNASLLKFIASAGLPSSVETRAYVAIGFESDARPAPAKIVDTTVRQAEAEGRIPSIENKELYEAYTLIRMRGNGFMLLGAPPAAAPGISSSVFIFSSAYGVNIDGIFIDGENKSPGKTGYNFVALAPGGAQIAATGAFETFSDIESGGKMQRFLDSQPEGSIALGSIKTGPGVFLTPDAVLALSRYGSTNEPNTQILSSHAIIGVRGAAAGTAIENATINGDASIVLFDSRLYVSPEAADSLNASPGARIVAIAGTAPDDRVIIIGNEY